MRGIGFDRWGVLCVAAVLLAGCGEEGGADRTVTVQRKSLVGDQQQQPQQPMVTEPPKPLVTDADFDIGFKLPKDTTRVGLPKPTTPLEEAWVEWFLAEEEMTEVRGSIRDVASARKAVERAAAVYEKRHQARVKIANLGGDEPVAAIMNGEFYRYRGQMFDRRNEAEKRLDSIPEREVVAVLQVVQPGFQELEKKYFRINPFRLDKALRGPEAKNVTITLINAQSAGRKHKGMVERIKMLGGATANHFDLDDQNDQARTLVMGPVADFEGFVQKLDVGTVTEVNAAARTLTLTIDPARLGSVEMELSEGEKVVKQFEEDEKNRMEALKKDRIARSDGENKKRIADGKKELAKSHPAEKIVEVRVVGKMDFDVVENVFKKVFVAAKAKGGNGQFLENGLETFATAYLVVTEMGVKELSEKVGLGKVTEVNEKERRITIEFDPATVK